MYEELIESSRVCAMGYNGNCDRCLFSGKSNDKDGDCYQQLHKAAADAIEKMAKEKEFLSEQVAHWQSETVKTACEVWIAENGKSHWISVAEGLPKTRDSILGKKSSKVIVAFRFDDGTQGTDTAYTLNGEWVFEDHITVVARTITHWMPMPEPPKEGE